MQPILISFSISLIGVIAAVQIFSVAMRGRKEENEETSPPARAPDSPGHFFLDEVASPLAGLDLPSDLLRLQLERHVRLEREAAASFLRAPSAESLQAPSGSGFRR